jgi:hypothetical protein
LLKTAVKKVVKSGLGGRVTVAWKRVADYILANGGTYCFGNATCRRKWDELVRLGEVEAIGFDRPKKAKRMAPVGQNEK